MGQGVKRRSILALAAVFFAGLLTGITSTVRVAARVHQPEQATAIAADQADAVVVLAGASDRLAQGLELMDDLVELTSKHAGPRPGDPCDILTIGQYLQPTRNHLPIDRWVTPETFDMFREEGLKRGIKVVESGPLVRSSYHADMQADELSSIGEERSSIAKVNDLIRGQ